MKILFVLDRPNLYGSEQHVLRLMDALNKDDEVSLLGFAEGPMLTKLSARNIPYTVIPLKWHAISKLGKIIRYFKTNNFDIIHAHQPKAIFWSSIAALIASIPCVITIHSLPSSNIQTYNSLIKKIVVGLFHYFVKLTSELAASRTIYLSKFSYAHAIFKRKSLIIPNWIDNVISNDEIKPSFKRPIRFISIGSVTSNKGMDRMIEALALIKHEDWTVQIVGDYAKEFKDFLLKSSIDLGISERLTFLGYREDVTQLMLESDGFILLSRGETFGLVYIEAMNCGLPVITWDIPAVHEILPAGNIIMSDVNDINKVFASFYSSQENYRALSLSNHEFVKSNFSLDRIYIKYKRLYDQVLSDNRN